MAKVGRPSKAELTRRAQALRDAANDIGKPMETTPSANKTENSTFDPNKFDGGYETAVGAETPASPNEPPIDAPKRGRPPGSRSKPVQINITGLEALLLGIHQTLQAATQVPEFGMSPVEAHNIAEAWAEAAKHYPVLNLDPKVAAIINLGTTISIVYGSRITAFKIRKSIERAQRRPIQPAPPTNQPTPVQHAGMMQEQVNGHIPEPPKPPVATREIRTGEIPGVGNIEFPPDHPLVKGTLN
jgi:hypothetical protein